MVDRVWDEAVATLSVKSFESEKYEGRAGSRALAQPLEP